MAARWASIPSPDRRWRCVMTSLEGWQGALVSGAAGIGAAWVILVVARLLIAPFRMWKGGKWYGREFVYDEPRLAIAIRASQDTNNFVHHFKFPDAPPFALIKYTVERATPYLHHVQVDVHPHWRGLRVMNADYLSDGELGRGSFYGGGSFRVRADRRMCASTFMRPQIDPTMVRIKITGWEL